MDPILRVLVVKIGDLNSKIQEASQKCLLELARHPKVTLDYVNIYIMEPLGDEQEMRKNWKNLVGRLELLEKMIPEFGISTSHHSTSKAKRVEQVDEEIDELIAMAPPQPIKTSTSSGFSIERIMTFCVSTFSSPNQQVRKAAVDCVVQVYKIAGDRIRSYLRESSNSFLLQELKNKVVKEARAQQNARINSAPMNQHRLSSIVQPLGMASEHDMRPQSFDAISQNQSLYGTSSRLGGGRKWNTQHSMSNEPDFVVTLSQTTPVAPSTVKKGKNNRFIFG
jgi:hypothetical protein